MKVIPVIDILNGIVVHAVRGKRKEYHPLKSTLCKSVDPLEVAKAFRTLGFNELYVADLDAIVTGRANYQVLKRVADETGLRLIVDAGVNEIGAAEKLLDNYVSKVVIGTETLTDIRFIGEAVKAFGSSRVIVSFDMMNDKLIGMLGLVEEKSPLDLLREFAGMGISQIIILDLARVGSGEGVNVDFLRNVLEELPFDVYVGGGVRDLNDLIELRDLGVSGVLIATALHSGKILSKELKKANLL